MTKGAIIRQYLVLKLKKFILKKKMHSNWLIEKTVTESYESHFEADKASCSKNL